MDIFFNINYKTIFGEELIVNIVRGNDSTSQLRMKTEDGEHWQCHIKTDDDTCRTIDYYYSVDCNGNDERHEWLVSPHKAEIDGKHKEVITIYDKWSDIPLDSYLYSSAFTDCIQRRKTHHAQPTDYQRTVTLKVRAPQLHAKHKLALVGSTKALGAWNAQKAIPMKEHSNNEWTVSLKAEMLHDDRNGNKAEFKFVIPTDEENHTTLWEEGENRTITLPEISNGQEIIYELDQAHFPIYDAKLAGTLVPLFSLRSKDSFGVGDFGDLKKMIDFIAKTNQRVLQLLPINDTTTTKTWTDSYPYSCISIFALHPQYADFNQLPKLKNFRLRKHFDELRKKLNDLSQIDYEEVNKAKHEYMMALYEQEGAKTEKSDEYRLFVKENNSWLIPYAQYCTLRDEYGNANFATWQGHETWHESDRATLNDEQSAEHKKIAFYLFAQFILCKQMSDAHDYAKKKGVILKGDIPIGVNRNGCDVWAEPRYFNLNSQAGAPPDAFSVNGQNWGFPTYNWEEMLKDDCAWWVRRFRNMAHYFDAYRIDHVLGFFRIWSIPLNSVHGLLGQFAPALGMTREEIEAYGLKFQEELFTRPFIADWIVDRVFGPHANYVKEKFLRHSHDDIYDMKPEFDTQRKIEAFFKGKTSEEDIWVRDGLYALVSNVLFIRDINDLNKFHPRITAQLDFMYEALWDADKAAFNKIYNDYYYRRNNQFWYREAMKKLPRLVQATRMLVCAEDLGMVPDCVPWVMEEERILSLEIQSMPKDPHDRFGHLSRNPYRSVCTISSHDMPTLRQWWDEDWERTQDYYNNMLYREGPAPHPLPGWLAKDIVSRHLTSPSMLCILSLQDWLAIDESLRLEDANAERINIPANPRHYWRYRMHLNIEDMMENKELVSTIKELVYESGRKTF